MNSTKTKLPKRNRIFTAEKKSLENAVGIRSLSHSPNQQHIDSMPMVLQLSFCQIYPYCVGKCHII